MRETVKLPQEKILAELNGPNTAPLSTQKNKPFPWGSVYLEVSAIANAIGCDVKWAVSGVFKAWVLLTAIGTFSTAIVLQNPSNFKLVWGFLAEQGSRPSVPQTKPPFDPLTGP
jgi:hypothetical protein